MQQSPAYQPYYYQAPFQYIQPIYYVPMMTGFVNPMQGYQYPAVQVPYESKQIVTETEDVNQNNIEENLREKKESESQQISERISNANKLTENFNQDSIKSKAIQKSTNIQKNYAKAIVHYAIRERVAIIKYLGEKSGIEFLKILGKLKNSIKNINHIKHHTSDEEHLKLFRILANQFLKNQAISYVYNSNIQSTSFHIQFRNQLKQCLQKC